MKLTQQDRERMAQLNKEANEIASKEFESIKTKIHNIIKNDGFMMLLSKFRDYKSKLINDYRVSSPEKPSILNKSAGNLTTDELKTLIEVKETYEKEKHQYEINYRVYTQLQYTFRNYIYQLIKEDLKFEALSEKQQSKVFDMALEYSEENNMVDLYDTCYEFIELLNTK